MFGKIDVLQSFKSQLAVSPSDEAICNFLPLLIVAKSPILNVTEFLNVPLPTSPYMKTSFVSKPVFLNSYSKSTLLVKDQVSLKSKIRFSYACLLQFFYPFFTLINLQLTRCSVKATKSFVLIICLTNIF